MAGAEGLLPADLAQKEAVTSTLQAGGGADATLYLGLAAAAFLLVLLYPVADASPAEQAAPAAAAAGGASLGAAKRAADLVQLQQLQQQQVAGSGHEAGDAGARAPNLAGALPTNRESSASLNLWLGVDRQSEPRPAPKDAVCVRPAPAYAPALPLGRGAPASTASLLCFLKTAVACGQRCRLAPQRQRQSILDSTVFILSHIHASHMYRDPVFPSTSLSCWTESVVHCIQACSRLTTWQLR